MYGLNLETKIYYILDKIQDRLIKQCNFRKCIQLVEKLAVTLRKEYLFYKNSSSTNHRTPQALCMLHAACFMLVSCLAYSSTPKMEAICSSQMSGGFQQTTQHHVSKDRTLHNNLQILYIYSWFFTIYFCFRCLSMGMVFR
jgi:hypothetical protein